MSSLHKLGIIGFGGQAPYHVNMPRETGKIEVAGTFDIKPEKMAFAKEKYGVKPYESLDELLSDNSIDIIAVVTPNDSHLELTEAALRAGKNVVCEKPAAMNSGELEQMIKTAKKCGKQLFINQNRRYDADFRVMKKIFDDGTLGPIHRFERRVHGAHGIPNDWRRLPQNGGGMMLDWGVHLLDQTLQLIPERVKRVYCRLEHVTNELVDDGVTMILTFESGIMAIVEVSTSNFIELPHWYMLGRDGSAIIRWWPADDGEIIRSVGHDGDVEPIMTGSGLTKTMAPRRDDTLEKLPLPRVEGDAAGFYRNVAAVLDGEAEREVTNESVLRVMRLMETGFESARQNRTLDFE